MIIKDITSEESIKENLEAWCFEVGSRFEEIGRDAADDFFHIWLKNNPNHPFGNINVIDLGCGDGASSLKLAESGFYVKAVDINKEKLDKIQSKFIKTYYIDMEDFLDSQKDDSIENIFTHHSLEHTIDAEEIIKLCGQKLKKQGIYYAVVPADDYLHSVHHIVFEDPLELLPEGLELIRAYKRERFGEKEFICIATK